MPSFLQRLLQNPHNSSYGLSLVAGALTTLALSPYHFVPILFITFPLLLLLLDKASSKSHAFFIGWWFGLGHFVIGLYWFAHALLTEADKYAWMIPFAVLGIPAIIAIYIGVITLAIHVLPFTAWRKALLFAIIWTVIEMLRGVLFTGFPWNLIGYSLAVSDATIQPAAWIGIYGLSFLTILIATLPYSTLYTILTNKDQKHSTRFLPAFVSFLLILLLAGIGDMRLKNHQTHYQDDIQLRLVQGNILQHHKWDPALRFDAFQKYLQLSRKPGWNDIDLVIWPETALPYTPNEHPFILPAIAGITPENGMFMSGSLRAIQGENFFQVWNSVHAIDRNEQVVTYYDKHHLVPFGEYIPFRTILPFINKITHGAVDFSRGDGPSTLHIDGLPSVSPLICYEAIFPGNVIDKSDRPQWMLNVTNDAWFGDSTAPHQHLTMARLRAVEEGIPLIRVANTGISASIDAFGRIIMRSKLNETTILDVTLPLALGEPTLYSKFGNGIIVILMALCLVPVFMQRRPSQPDQ